MNTEPNHPLPPLVRCDRAATGIAPAVAPDAASAQAEVKSDGWPTLDGERS